MAKSANPIKPTKETHRTSSSNSSRRRKESECEQKTKKKAADSNNKPPSWAVMRSILTCKHLQVEQQQHQQHQQEKQLPKQKHQKQNQEDEISSSSSNNKKSKKMRCSGSLCNNTKVITERPTTTTTTADQQQSASASSPELLFSRRKVSASSSFHSSSSSSFSMSMVGSDQTVSSRSFGSTTITSSSSSSLISAASNSQNATAVKGVIGGGSFKGMPFRKLSGCYECRAVVDPVLGLTRDPSLRATISSCPQCGDIFMKPDLLELHLATKHAVSELGPEDTSRNIVEIIFQSSWLKKEIPVCKIDRILKVHNTNRTVSRFEEYRDLIKGKATRLPKKHPRCIADGNELLRFHCTTLMCSLGLNGSSNLCNSSPSCNVCGIIRDGFKSGGPHQGSGILTTATSGRAHDRADVGGPGRDHHPHPGGVEPRKAMLVCRVIAGRMKKAVVDGSSGGAGDGVLEEYDSVAGVGGVYSDLDELYVYNPKAILPCFVVIYRGF